MKFDRPSDDEGGQRHLANAPGIRHIAFVVEEIEAVVAELREKGAELVGEIRTYGIILELAEKIK